MITTFTFVEQLFTRLSRRTIIMNAARQLKLEGRQEGMHEVAKNMLQKGLDIKIIEEVTSLNRQTIEELRK